MTILEKIDSNVTGLAYAEEESLGELGATPKWTPLEPNEYDDFGGELTLMARNPINSSRQRKKGVITDLDASGGFNQDFTQTNFQDLLQGVMFADFRRKAEATPSAVAASGYTVAAGVAATFRVGAMVFASGFANNANNGLKIVTANAGTTIAVAGAVVEAVTPAGAKVVTVGHVGAADDLKVTKAAGELPRLESTALDFTTLGLVPGEWVLIGGDGATERFATAENNGFKRIAKVEAHALTLDRSALEMVTEAGAGLTVRLFVGRALKNELGSLVKRRSYQIERQLGAPDPAQPTKIQAEYLVGAVANEFTLNIETADKINADISFVATNNEQRTAAQGIKAGTRIPLIESDAFNTSSDFASMRLAVIDKTKSASAPLFAYLNSLSVTINNNVKPNKAVAVLGAFDVTAGTFAVSGEASAYFSTIEAVQAVRRNDDVSLFAIIAKQGAGFVLDLPLIGLGGAQADVVQDEPIMLPLNMDAATAAKINPETDYTAMWVFFDYLPASAMPQ